MACCSVSSNENERVRKLLSETMQGIITANGFFSAAVFFGITGTVTPSASVPQHCIPGDDIVQSLFLFEVLSFCFYVLSSLVAQGMKLTVARLEAIDPDGGIPITVVRLEAMPVRATNKRWRLRKIMMVSAMLSLVGSFFLMLSMVDVIQLKLGLLSCGGTMAIGAVLAPTVVMFAGTVVYGVTVIRLMRPLPLAS